MHGEYPSWRRDGFTITTDPATTDLELVCAFLARSYWARDIPRGRVERSIQAARVYNLRDDQAECQIGFARVVGDDARIAWLSDVFVVESHRGRGFGKWLVATVMADPRLAPVGRWLLATSDAHDLYRRHGWRDAPAGRYMVLERS
jgi:GNAT superfamily N-acetyltransferase